jgi:membrane-bound ClpP family serine protease
MKDRLTVTRLVLAITSTGMELVAIWAIWRWALPDFGIELPFSLLITVMIAWAAFGTWLFIFTTRILKRQAQRGLSSMVGTEGSAVKTLDPKGLVKIRGELWGAVSEEGKIDAGTEVVVVGQDGLKLFVRKSDGAGITH